MSKKLTTEEFIAKAITVHGNRYDYSSVDYKKSREKVSIICKVHGLFEQLPANHISHSNGCPYCVIDSRRSNKDTFISAAIEVHGERYDYCMVEYAQNKLKVKIICRDHGAFNQSTNNHLNGAGCPSCGNNDCGDKKRKSLDDFKKEAIAIHGNRYDYTYVIYNGSHEKVKIVCNEHGVFEQTPGGHLNGAGCPICANEFAGNRQRKSLVDFIESAIAVHGNKYDYSCSDYSGSKTKIRIICKEHGVFEQTPNNHLTGYGCADCAISGFDYKKPGFVYYLRLDSDTNATLHKIGITNFDDVDVRVKSLGLRKDYRVTVVAVFAFNVGMDAYNLEQELHKKHNEHRYYGEPVMNNGNTELFVKDVLKLSGEEL